MEKIFVSESEKKKSLSSSKREYRKCMYCLPSPVSLEHKRMNNPDSGSSNVKPLLLCTAVLSAQNKQNDAESMLPCLPVQCAKETNTNGAVRKVWDRVELSRFTWTTRTKFLALCFCIILAFIFKIYVVTSPVKNCLL